LQQARCQRGFFPDCRGIISLFGNHRPDFEEGANGSDRISIPEPDLRWQDGFDIAVLTAARHHDTKAVTTLGYAAASAWPLLSVAGSVFLLATGMAALRVNALPRWLAWVTIGLGVLALLGHESYRLEHGEDTLLESVCHLLIVDLDLLLSNIQIHWQLPLNIVTGDELIPSQLEHQHQRTRRVEPGSKAIGHFNDMVAVNEAEQRLSRLVENNWENSFVLGLFRGAA